MPNKTGTDRDIHFSVALTLTVAIDEIFIDMAQAQVPLIIQ